MLPPVWVEPFVELLDWLGDELFDPCDALLCDVFDCELPEFEDTFDDPCVPPVCDDED